MKKIMTLCLTMLSCLTMSAQDIDKTFEFCDKDGNIIADGSTVTYDEVEEDPDFGTVTVHADLYIKNVTDEGSYAAIECIGSEMPNGNFKICFPTLCIQTGEKSFDINTDGGGKPDGNAITKEDGPISLETAWLPEGYGSFNVTYQINRCEYRKVQNPILSEQEQLVPVATGNKITVKFVYADPAGIKGVKDIKAKKEVARYNIGGQKIKDAQNGISIVKYSDGTTIKTAK